MFNCVQQPFLWNANLSKRDLPPVQAPTCPSNNGECPVSHATCPPVGRWHTQASIETMYSRIPFAKPWPLLCFERSDQNGENILSVRKIRDPKCLHRVLVPKMHWDLLKQSQCAFLKLRDIWPQLHCPDPPYSVSQGTRLHCTHLPLQSNRISVVWESDR